MGYLSYFLWMIAWRYPYLLIAIVAYFILRRWIPDPYVYLRTFGRIRALRAQVDNNAANILARRDLARLYLERRRPKAALTLLREALKRDPNNAELLHLAGVALYRTGDFEGALATLGDAVHTDARIGFGDPYLVAGDSLMGLGRFADAEQAYLQFVDANSSSVEGKVKLARARAKAGDKAGASHAVADAIQTWNQIPGFRRRGQWTWWLRARLGLIG